MNVELPVGGVVPSRPAVPPPRSSLHGLYTSLIPLQPSHSASIFKHLGGEENFWRWTYMFSRGFLDLAECESTIAEWAAATDRVYYAVLNGPESDPASEAAGVMAYFTIAPSDRRLEIGNVIFGAQLAKSRVATEATCLLLRHAFEDLGYLRVEWKANELNKPSLAAATRLGFTYEGTFRKHMVIKGRHRDTAWFSVVIDEWPEVSRGFIMWLKASNFDDQGRQQMRLQDCRKISTT